jgi:hypothetical protein
MKLLSSLCTDLYLSFISNDLENEAAAAVQSLFRSRKAKNGKGELMWSQLRKGKINWKYIRLVQNFDSELVKYLPLINQLLFLDIPENPYTILLTTEERNAKMKEYMVNLISLFERHMGHLLVIVEVSDKSCIFSNRTLRMSIGLTALLGI